MWPKLTKMVRGQPLLFAQFLPFFQLFENGSKGLKMTLGVVQKIPKHVAFVFEPFLNS